MNNERGSLVALVLIILGVVSLIGVAALIQTKFDLKFVQSFQTYDQMFNLADGAANMAFRFLEKNKPRVTPTSKNPQPDVDLGAPANGSVVGVGYYSATLKFYNYDTSARRAAGWEAGSYYAQFWAARGKGGTGRGGVSALLDQNAPVDPTTGKKLAISEGRAIVEMGATDYASSFQD